MPDSYAATASGPAKAASPSRRFRAPARINIIGEHTDYNDGLVLPTNTALYTQVAATARVDRLVEIYSESLAATRRFDLDDLAAAADVDWLEYIRGVAAVLETEGVSLCGAELVIDSDIPIGAGLSSSASLELAVAMAFLSLAGAERMRPDTLAVLCQRAEHDYARVRCGIMDQYSVACAPEGCAILLDCATLETRPLQLPTELGLIIFDSGVRHRLPDGEYNSRRGECATALATIEKAEPRIRSMRDLTIDGLESRRHGLDETQYRRCRHVVTENTRVELAVAAIRARDIEALGRLISESHASLRDDFDTSCEEIEALVAIADSAAGGLGSRMIGGGFGGCVLVVCRRADAHRLAADISKRYSLLSDSSAWSHVVQPAQPAREIGRQ